VADLSRKWIEANRAILDAVDIEQEYRRCGVRIPERSKPRATGWLPVHAVGRDDDTPSAEINVGDGPPRGRYRDFGGNGETLGFFDFVAKFMPGAGGDWRAARKHYAQQTKIKLPSGDDTCPQDKFEFFDLTPGAALGWTSKKPGIKASAVMACGGRGARWPKGLRAELTHCLIVFPMFGAGGLDLEPQAWHCVNSTGQKIRKFKGEGNEPDLLKTMTVGPPGIMGVAGLRGLAAARVVWLTEGISDLLALQTMLSALPEEVQADHVVLSFGAATYHCRADWIPLFMGKDVRFVYDADKPGQAGALASIAAVIRSAAKVRNVQLPYEIGENHGKDLRDYILEGRTFDDLCDLAERQAPIDPGTAADALVEPHKLLLEQLGIIVCGQVEGTEAIEIFSTKLHKKTLVRDIDKLSFAKGILSLGGDVMDTYVTDSREGEPGKYSMGEVRNAVAREAGKMFLSHQPDVGSGIWPVEDSLVLVGPRSADIWNGKKQLEQILMPAVKGQRLDFGGEQWYDREKLGRLLERAADLKWCQAVLDEAINLFDKWDNWRRPSSPWVLAGLACASWIQTTWDFRPQVAVIGPTNSGKSFLVEKTLPKIFANLCLPCQRSTEAGIRQVIGNTGQILIIDEFEDDANRKKILDMFRTSSRGGRMVRGTRDQRPGGQNFGLKHIAWVSSIELNLTREPDANRFIILELAKVTGPAKLVLPDPEVLADLGQKLLAVAIRHWREMTRLSTAMKSRDMGGVSNRIVEVYSVPVAVLAHIRGYGHDETAQLLRQVIGDLDRPDSRESEEEQLLRAIYEATVILPRGSRVMFSQLLQDQVLEDGDGLAVDRRKLINALGVKLVEIPPDRPEDPEKIGMFFAKSILCKELLKNTEWASKDVNQMLLRIPGAKGAQMQRLGSHVSRGVVIPLDQLNKLVELKLDVARLF